MHVSRRELLCAGAAGLLATSGCEKPPVDATPSAGATGRKRANNLEYVWVSANAHLPLFVAHDHLALEQVGRELGVKVTIAGPDAVDLPGLVSAVEQTAARKPTGMMVVGWFPDALVPVIDRIVDSGIPVVCVDADVPKSKRLAFIGTDWYDLGVRQAQAMLQALKGRQGKVALLGLIEQYIDQQAFAGFRSIAEPAGLKILEPFQDKGNQVEAAKVAANILQAHDDLVGMAGFDSESGPGIGQAIKEAGKAGQVIGTTVEAEAQHLQYLKEGMLTACVKQKRELFTYYGVKALDDYVHSTLAITADDRRLGIVPIPVNYNTGTFTITKDNMDVLMTEKKSA